MQTLGVKPSMNIVVHSQETMEVVINRKIEFIYSKQTKWLKVLVPSLISKVGGKCLFDEFQCEIESLTELERVAIQYYVDKVNEFKEVLGCNLIAVT